MNLKQAFNRPEQDRALAKAVKDDDILAMMDALEKGADPNVRDPATGRTLLFGLLDKLANPFNEGIVGSLWAHFHLLVKNGADPNLCGNDGVSALHYGFNTSVMMTSTMLMAPEIDLNAADPRSGDTPMHKALRLYLDSDDKLREVPLNLLAVKGADATIPNHAGVSAYDIVCKAEGDRVPEARRLIETTPAVRRIFLREKSGGKPAKLKPQ